uniref:PH domain-containing protein n=1 Tax=Timema cristinae TaxID=61476 RepID=A0A7R9GQT0_TIMCR|nr:unnamed protein product [Timema cristinae]
MRAFLNMEPSEDSVRKGESKARKVLDERRVVLADLEEQHTYQDIISQSKDTFLDAEVVKFPSEKPTLAAYHLWHPWFIMTEDDPFIMIPSIRVGSDHSQSETAISSTYRDKSTSLLRFQPDRCRMEGVLCKWTNPIEGWRYRFFVLDDVLGKLHYFTVGTYFERTYRSLMLSLQSKQKLLRGEHRGSVTLRRARVLKDEVDQSAFSIAVDRRILYLQARDPNEREAWVEALQSSIVEQNISKIKTTVKAACGRSLPIEASTDLGRVLGPTYSPVSLAQFLMAELVKHYYPRLVELHNYVPASSTSAKLINWATLNRKVLVKLRLQVHQKMIEDLAGAVPGAVEQLLVELHRHIMHNNSPAKGEMLGRTLDGEIKSGEQKMALANKEKQMKEKEEAIYMLNSKVSHLESLLELKEQRIKDLTRQLQRYQQDSSLSIQSLRGQNPFSQSHSYLG